MTDAALTAKGEPRRSSPGHGGARAVGAGGKPTSAGPGRPPKAEQADAYTLLAKAKAKRETHKAQLAELEWREKAGQLLDAAEVESTWSAHITVAKTALLGLPSKLAHELAAVSEPARVAEIMRARIHEILTELSAGPDGRRD